MFWMSLLYCFIAGVLMFVLIGFLIMVAILVWWIIRCVKGLKHLDQKAAYPDYLGWAF
jgi:uncharacterized membrane protein